MTYEEFKAQHDAYWAAHPEELAEIDARSDAMVACAEVYERALADQVTAIKQLEQTDDGAHMMTRIAGVIALEQLRCAALGCGVPSWEQALHRHRVLVRATVDAIKPIFRKEAAGN